MIGSERRRSLVQSSKAAAESLFPFVDESLFTETKTARERGLQFALYFFRMSWKMVLVSILAAITTYFSFENGFLINLRGNNLIALAVVFPIVFSINAAYSRREDALRSLAAIHGNLYAIRLSHAHWNQGKREKIAVEVLVEDADDIINSLYDSIREFLRDNDDDSRSVKLQPLLDNFAALSLLNERLREEGDVSAPEISRVNEYIRITLVHFETLRVIREYRTPASLRAFTKFFIFVVPIVYGPVFSYIANESGDVWHGIVLAVLYAIVLTALDNTQEALENPYDGLSPDDIRFRKPTVHLSRPISNMRLDSLLPNYYQHQVQLREKQRKQQEEAAALSSGTIAQRNDKMYPLAQDELAATVAEDTSSLPDKEMTKALAEWQNQKEMEMIIKDSSS